MRSTFSWVIFFFFTFSNRFRYYFIHYFLILTQLDFSLCPPIYFFIFILFILISLFFFISHLIYLCSAAKKKIASQLNDVSKNGRFVLFFKILVSRNQRNSDFRSKRIKTKSNTFQSELTSERKTIHIHYLYHETMVSLSPMKKGIISLIKLICGKNIFHLTNKI